jgi:hypothetical protein
MLGQMGGRQTLVTNTVWTAVLVCEQGAKQRKLDLKVAAADARLWWEKRQVPLRATPRAGRG